MNKLAAALALALSLLSVDAAAFERTLVPGTDICLWWRGRTLSYALNKLGSSDVPGDAELNAIRASFKTWEDVGCTDIAFVEQGLTDRTDIGFNRDATDNIDLIVFREANCTKVAPSSDACWKEEGGCTNKYNCWEESAETIAFTLTTFNTKTGEITDADIELNGDGYLFTTVDSPPCPRGVTPPKPPTCVVTDVQNTVTHEIGHFLGLAHPPVREACMYATTEPGETSKRKLAQDDVTGICTIYPQGKATATCVAPEPDEVVGDGCLGCGGSNAASLAVLGLGLGVARRRRG